MTSIVIPTSLNSYSDFTSSERARPLWGVFLGDWPMAGTAHASPLPNGIAPMAKRSRAHGQICFAPWPKGVAPMHKERSWRQLRQVLTPTRMAGHMGKIFGHGRIRGWPQENSRLATGQIAPCQASKGLWYVSERHCPLVRNVRSAFPTCRGHPPPIAGLLQSVTNEMRLSITSRNAHTMLLSAQRFSPNARRLPHHLNADKR